VLHRKTKRLPADQPREAFRNSVNAGDYGLGLDVVVVVVELEFDDGLVVVVFVFVVSLVSFVFSVVGFTTVVLFSTFFSGAGELPGATTVSFCSHPPRSAALAKMQNNFFIGLDWLPILDNAESIRAQSPALPNCDFRNALQTIRAAARIGGRALRQLQRR
jgi:hypothetical protein